MSWEQGWLEYRDNKGYKGQEILENIYYNHSSKVMDSAIKEAKKAFCGMFGMTTEEHNFTGDDTLTPGLYLEIDKKYSKDEGFVLSYENDCVRVKSRTDRGILYGVFALIRLITCGRSLEKIDREEIPDNPLRMLNHWDNMDGSIERGYSGDSFFFKDGVITVNERIVDYARLVASIGVNGVVINNVNVAGDAIDLITERYAEPLIEIADIFEAYGIKLFLSLDYAASIDVGGMTTADPLDEEVAAWWENKMAEVFGRIHNFGGFLIKADSEGRPGPFTYKRTHADGANMLARAAKPYGGLIIWRCFVYNCQQDWRDYKTDRARAGFDHFMPLDGTFDENVILQIKNGPMDFQVREPVSPLIGGLTKTNQILEFQIAQEYTGQQKHVCYLIPMWKEILAFKTYCKDRNDTVKDIVSGETYNQTLCGISAVINTGNDRNWTGHDLAAANLYGYGRLIWDTSLSSEAIAEEWVNQTLSIEEQIVNPILEILKTSWPAYENYTSPLGIGWMVNQNHHYGPNVDGYEYDRWGTYHRADCHGIGVDRTECGTGYVTQYFEKNKTMYGDIETCPEELLLFFHHLDYKHQLTTGKTVIQHIYDTHFDGVESVQGMLEHWKSLEGKISEKIYDRTLARLMNQLEHSKEWRDVVNTYFYRKSRIVDEKGRKIYE